MNLQDLQDCPTYVLIFFMLGLFFTYWAVMTGLYALNWALVSWWQRRKAPTDT